MKLAQLDYQKVQGYVDSFGFGVKHVTFGNTQNIVALFVNTLIPYIFVAAGLILIIFIIISGISLITAAGDPKKSEGAKANLTSSIIGFTIIFAAYWVYEIVRFILGIR